MQEYKLQGKAGFRGDLLSGVSADNPRLAGHSKKDSGHDRPELTRE